VQGALGKSLTRMGVGFWCEVTPVVETTLLPRTMLFEIWLRSPDVEMAEPEDAGRLMRYKKELLTPALGFAVRFVQVISKVERGLVLTRGTKLTSQDFPAVRKKVWWYEDIFIK
jgi:hypothetical protein